MAPTKKRGAPASASKPVPSKKLTRAEKSAANKARWKKLQIEETKRLQAMRPPANRTVVHGATPKPVDYDVELGHKICLMFATDPGMSLLRLNSDPEFPTVWHFYEWLRDNPTFEKLYARARELQTDLQAAQLEEWSAEPMIGTRTTRRTKSSVQGSEVSEETQEYDNIERAKLRVATRQWLLARLRPKKYGVQPEPAGPGANDQLNALFESLKTEAPTDV